MTDYYIAKDGTSGGTGSIGDPVETVAQVLSLGAGLGDTVFFRVGTYDTELDNGGDSTYQFKLPLEQVFSVKGYPGETVTFQPDNSVSYLLAYVSGRNTTGAELTVTVENINFITAADGSGCSAFMRLDSHATTADKIIWNIQNCTFTQTENQHSLINGVFFSNSVPTVGQTHTIENCTFTISHEHIINFTSMADTVNFKNNTVTVTQPAGATANQVDKLFFLAGPNNISRVSQVNIENNTMDITLDDRNDAEQIFQFDYINNCNFIDNDITTHKHPSQSAIGGTLGDIIRFYQSGNGTIHAHRQLKTVVLSGNKITRNDVRGNTFNFAGYAGGTEFAGSTVTCTYNQDIRTDPINRTNDTGGAFLTSNLHGQSESWIIKYNRIQNCQDGVSMLSGGSGTNDISYNYFGNIGDDTAPLSTSVALKLNAVGSSSSRTPVHNNVFDNQQKAYQVQLIGDTHCDLVDNTFITRVARTGSVGAFVTYFNTPAGTGSQHTILGNRYLNTSNNNSNILATQNGIDLANEAALKAYDTDAMFTNLTSKLTSDVNRKGYLTKTLGL